MSQSPSPVAADNQARGGVIPAVLEMHLDEFQSMFAQRLELFDSGDLTAEDLRDWDQRIQVHLDGILLAGEGALPQLTERLNAGDAESAFGAAYVLLRMATVASTKIVMGAFPEAQNGQIQGLRDALRYGPVDAVLDELRNVFELGPKPAAAAAAEVLAWHKKLDSVSQRLESFFTDEDPLVRQMAWRTAANLGK